MSFTVPGGIETLFGGAVRTKILGYLAACSAPQTGYAVAKDLDIGVSKVYPELERLEAARVLTVRRDINGRKGFLLADEDLRRFLLRRVRILPSGAWRTNARNEGQERAWTPPGIGEPNEQTPRERISAREFQRPPAKDRALRRLRRAGSLRQ